MTGVAWSWGHFMLALAATVAVYLATMRGKRWCRLAATASWVMVIVILALWLRSPGPLERLPLAELPNNDPSVAGSAEALTDVVAAGMWIGGALLAIGWLRDTRMSLSFAASAAMVVGVGMAGTVASLSYLSLRSPLGAMLLVYAQLSFVALLLTYLFPPEAGRRRDPR
jgi:hypothetical protein